MPSLRTTASKTFTLSDGNYETELFAQPIFYREESTSTLQPIDCTLEETITPRGTFLRSRANAFTTWLPDTLNDEWVSIETTVAKVAFRPASRPFIPEAALAEDALAERMPLTQGSARYEGSFTAADLEYTSMPNGLKETIVLDRYSGRNVYSFDMIAEGLTPHVNDAGGVDLVSVESTAPVFQIAPPIMEDGSLDALGEHAVSTDVHYEIEPSLIGWQLHVVASDAWLADPQRVYPVRIDPTVRYGWYEDLKATMATFAYDGTPSTNYYGWYEAGQFTLKTGSPGSGNYRTFLYSGMVDSAYQQLKDFGEEADVALRVIDAQMSMYCYNHPYAAGTLACNRIDGPWSDTTLTWNKQPATTFKNIYAAVADDTWTTFDITSIAQDWWNGVGAGNKGVMVWGATDPTTYSKFTVWDDPNYTYHPFMRFAYTTVPEVELISPDAQVPVCGNPEVIWSYDDQKHRLASEGQLISKPQEGVQIQVCEQVGGPNVV